MSSVLCQNTVKKAVIMEKNYVLLFPGQGKVSSAVVDELKAEGESKHLLAKAEAYLGFNVFEKPLERTQYGQLAVFLHEAALVELVMKKIGYPPKFAAGHSLGLYTAYQLSNALNFLAALELVQKRAEFMQAACDKQVSGMTAIIGPSFYEVHEVCEPISSFKDNHVVILANYNSPIQTVIAGHQAALKEAGEKLAAKGAKVIPLKVNGAFHSPLMKEAHEQLIKLIDKMHFNDPYVGIVDEMLFRSKAAAFAGLRFHLIRPVYWQRSLEHLLINLQMTRFIEVGPGKVLTRLLIETAEGYREYVERSGRPESVPDFKAISIESPADLAKLEGFLN